MSLVLDVAARDRGYRLEQVPTIASTNDGALDRAAAGAPGKLWLVADEQTGGRGRRGRAWNSPVGNLYASLLLLDPGPMSRLAELGFVAGVAVAAAVAELGVARDAFAIKWPNDLVARGAKFTGLLLETRTVATGLAVVIGCGVNCLWHPDNLAYPTTELAALAGRPVSPGAVFTILSRTMAERLETWRGGAGFDRIRREWLDVAAGLGEPMRVDTGTRALEGRFEGIDDRGRLLLRAGTQVVTIDAGDVFLGASAMHGAADAPGTGT